MKREEIVRESEEFCRDVVLVERFGRFFLGGDIEIRFR